LILATYDPLAAAAATNVQVLSELFENVNSGEAGVQALLGELAARELGLFKDGEEIDPWDEWKGMPEFENEDNFGAVNTIKVHFATEEAIKEFSELIGQPVTINTVYIWHPKQERENLKQYVAYDES